MGKQSSLLVERHLVVDRIGCNRLWSQKFVIGLIFLLALAVVLDAEAQSPPVEMQRSPIVSSNIVRPGDLIRLRIWREPDLSGDFAIDAAGFVTLPRLGAVEARSQSSHTLSESIRQRYGEFLNHASIEVVILSRVQVLGSVHSPGLYHADPTMSVSEVLALAGGATRHGHMNRVYLYRDGDRIADLTLMAQVGRSPIESGDQLFVPERNWISRNPGIALGIVSTAFTIAITLLR
jgi:protein involved in polysaccharide export with SLBB domain